MEGSVTEIFEKYSVDDVLRICAEIRNDVESKKMELRFLVGERHRDVIEASDNILKMKDFSHSIIEKLEQLEKSSSYKSPFLASSISQQSGNPKKLIASQLKLLLDIPEMIWSALDEMDYTKAVQIFLLGRFLSVKMQLTGETQAAHVDAFVLVKRQWAALDHIENTIASTCRKQLTLPTISNEILAQALTALLVLEDHTMSTALDEFLSGRTAALRCVLGVDETSNARISISFEQRLFKIVRVLTQAVEIVKELFLPEGQIVKLLNQMSNWCPRETTWFSGENLYEHLPENVALYRITQAPVQSRQPKSPILISRSEDKNCDAQPSGVRACPLPLKDLARPLNEWWQSTLGLCQQRLSTSLAALHLVDLTELTDTRRTLLSTLSTTSPDTTVNDGDDDDLLGLRVDLWNDLFQPIFLVHLEVLLGSTLNEIFAHFESALLSLAKSLDMAEEEGKPQANALGEKINRLNSEQMSLERDLASFVWSQSSISTGSLTQQQLNLSSSFLDDSVDELDICQQNLTRVYFACLVGRKDLLPRSDSSNQVSGSLKWRLSRLLESCAATYSAFDCRGDGGEDGANVINETSTSSLKQRLVTPRLKRICSTFNNRLCEVVAIAASEDVATWNILLTAVEGLLKQCCAMVQRISAELPSRGGAREAFCVARACFCLLDVYPALGATFVTATARLLAEEANGVSSTPWTDVTKLRQSWLSASKELRVVASRLSLTAVLRATVESPALENLFQSLCSVCHTSSNSDAKLVSVTSQWFEVTWKPSLQDSDLSEAVVGLKIPCSPSWPLQESLFAMARNLTTLSVHLLPRPHTEELGVKLAEGLLNVYLRLVRSKESKLTQSQAFQMLFDVRFILRLLVWPLTGAQTQPPIDTAPSVDDVAKIGQDLLKRLESAVDPFDLEMSLEHLNAGIGYAVQTTSVLYAALLPVAFVNSFSSASEGIRAEGSKFDEFSNLAFLSLIPSAKRLEGRETGKEDKTVFGLVPFSLFQVQPLPQVTPVVKTRSQQPQEKSKGLSSIARGSTSDFSWFRGFSFT